MDGTRTNELWFLNRNAWALPGVSDCRSFRIFNPNENAGECFRWSPAFSGAYAVGAENWNVFISLEYKLGQMRWHNDSYQVYHFWLSVRFVFRNWKPPDGRDYTFPVDSDSGQVCRSWFSVPVESQNWTQADDRAVLSTSLGCIGLAEVPHSPSSVVALFQNWTQFLSLDHFFLVNMLLELIEKNTNKRIPWIFTKV